MVKKQKPAYASIFMTDEVTSTLNRLKPFVAAMLGTNGSASSVIRAALFEYLKNHAAEIEAFEANTDEIRKRMAANDGN